MNPAALLLALACALQGSDALGRAEELAKERRHDEVVALLGELHRREPGDARTHALHGEALYRLGRMDEAAHHLAIALDRIPDAPDEKRERELLALLVRADPLTQSREAFFRKTTGAIADAAEALIEAGQHERAIEALERAAPFAPESARKERAKLLALLAAERARLERVDLDGASEETPEVTEARPLVEIETERYVLRANLEPDVAELLGRTMDDVFESYVAIYFDGDAKRVQDRKATIRVHPDHASMMTEWSDPTRQVGGWWSPGDWQVTCYDTRSDAGTLDAMLSTLFHEASHQFMTMREQGGNAPSWLNEGTASFFEGAVAMSDGRVLWPDVAPGRLYALASMLRSKDGPTLRQVVAYDEPSSYPGDHYPFGWGLVYFLQQWEDPETLVYAWRPAYLAYLERATSRGGPSLAAFEEIVLAPDNPGGFQGFDELAAAWEAWVLDEVYPMHFGADARARRSARLARYVEAAAEAEGRKDAPVPADELLLRALGQVEKLFALEPPEEPDLALRLTEIELHQRLGRGATAAARIEALLELAARERIALEPELALELDQRMAKLDARSYPLRALRTKLGGLRGAAEDLLERYERRREPLTLRAWSFAREAAAALGDEGELQARADALRVAARDLGLVPSRILRVGGARWETIYAAPPRAFAPGDGRLEAEMPALPAAAICADVEVAGEYEVRARVLRPGEVYGSSRHGLVVSGSERSDWIVVAVDGGGDLLVKRIERGEGGGTTSPTVAMEPIQPALEEGEEIELAVRVLPGGRLRVTVGARAPIAIDVPGDPPPDRGHVGYYVTDGRIALEDFVVEIFP